MIWRGKKTKTIRFPFPLPHYLRPQISKRSKQTIMQLCGILDVLIITCMLREVFTSYFRAHVSLNINQAQTYGGRADVGTTQYCRGCFQQDLHTLSKLLLLGQGKTFWPIHPSNSSRQANLLPTMHINLAILVPMAISSAQLPLIFP